MAPLLYNIPAIERWPEWGLNPGPVADRASTVGTWLASYNGGLYPPSVQPTLGQHSQIGLFSVRLIPTQTIHYKPTCFTKS